MLAYFPAPYHDELLYSVIARYAVHTGQTDNQKAVLRDVFASPSAVAIPDLPSHLSALTKQLRHVWNVTAQEIIQRHTLAPLYLPFLRPEQAEQIIKSMLSSQGGSIHTRAGIAASSIPQHQFFRYCPSCVIDQLDVLGEPYWRRIHQVTGVNYCIKHRCKLVVSDLQFHPKQKHLYQAAAKTSLESKPASAEPSKIEALLAYRFCELLDFQSLGGHTSYQWTIFYQKLAMRMGFVSGNRVDHVELQDKLLQDWKGTEYEDLIKSNWLISFFRKHRKTFHPLRHLLVWCSLLPDVSVKEIIRDVDRQPKKEPRITGKCHTVLNSQNVMTQAQRELWLQLLKKNGKHGIKAIRSASPGGAIYAWLYRNDRAWLMMNKPSRIKKNDTVCQTDYGAWDRLNIVALETFKTVAIQDDKRKRLSSTFFIKHLPRANSVEKHLSDLPKTKKWLEQHAESIVDYQLFRIERAARFLHEQFEPVKKWRLLRLAGIRTEKITPNIEHLIRKLELQGGLIVRDNRDTYT